MKGMKKLLSILMVLTLVLSLSATAFAATISVTPLEGDTVTHTYEAYQIFSGTQDTTEGDDAPLGNIEWGSGINGDNFLAALKDDDTLGATFEDCNTAADVAAKLTDAIADKFAEIAEDYLTNVKTDISSTEEGKDVGIGYYLIKDTTEVDGTTSAKNKTMLQVTRDVTITAKYNVPSSDKKVKDTNDTSGETTDWVTNADWDIGDQVPFKLEATIPAGTTTDYETYKLVFHDHEEQGLTFNQSSVKVMVGNQELTLGEDYTIAAGSEDSDPCTFEITINDIMTAIDGFESDQSYTITVTYTSELNKNAVIGNYGNHNEMYLEFSNHGDSTGTGKTPEKKVVVFTYDMDVNKVDGEGDKLEGAQFALYKEVPALTKGAFQLLKDGSKAEHGESDDALLHADKWYIASPKDLVMDSNDKSLFTAEGLDDGNYVIVETETPAGFNTAAPIEFTLDATHTDERTDVTSPANDDTFSVTMTPDENEAIIDTNVVNNKGATLPETGGIGTTIFYIAGAVLVAGAVIILVTKRRVSGAEK